MRALTPSERRGALVVVLLLGLGAARDLIVARLAPPTPPPVAAGAEARPEPGPAPPLPVAPASRPPLAPAVRLDLNRASAEELDRLPGIGPVLARRILERRSAAGPYRSVDELRVVRGVGPRLLERLRPYVSAGPSAPDAVRGTKRRMQCAREAAHHAADSAQVRAGPVR